MTAVGSLEARLDAFPRLRLAQYPTPLDALPRLSRELGMPVFIKREAAAGAGLGGNKTRNLEYLVADALEQHARRIVTFGALHSNHALLTAEVARRQGLEAHVLYFERRPQSLGGNARLTQQAGARLHFVPLGGRRARMTIETANRLVRVLAWGMVGPHYFVPVGGCSWRGCIGYVRAALETDEQARAAGIPDARLVVAAGTGATLAGLLAGCALTGSSLRPLGIDIGNLWRSFPSSVARTASDVCARLGSDRRFAAAEVPLVCRAYVGDGYALPSTGGAAAIESLARFEGIRLDPVYTGKAFAGLLDLAERGALGTDKPVIFLHTGGTKTAGSSTSPD
jgi:1-aminocyclopropane-1-carboxylate deaminase/D-cysteine desulfhydrase-like pyridoxal-dependent ACC family enzyme